MNATISSNLMAAAVTEARTQLAKAESVDTSDLLAVIRSQSALAATLERLLWNIDPEFDDVAAQVDAEDGVTKAVYVPFNRQSVAA